MEIKQFLTQNVLFIHDKLSIAHLIIRTDKNKRNHFIIMWVLAEVSFAAIRMKPIAQRVTSDQDQNKHHTLSWGISLYFFNWAVCLDWRHSHIGTPSQCFVVYLNKNKRHILLIHANGDFVKSDPRAVSLKVGQRGLNNCRFQGCDNALIHKEIPCVALSSWF